MHIGINTLSVVPGETGGGETYLVSLLHALISQGDANRYTLFTTAQNRSLFDTGRANCECIEVAVSHRPTIRRVLYEHILLPRLVKKSGVDVLFSPGNAGIPVKNCAQVVCIQSMLYSLMPAETGWFRVQYFKRIVPWSVRHADMVIAVSQDTRERIMAATGVCGEKVRLIHEGVDSAMQRPEQAQIDAELSSHGLDAGYILFVSTLKPYKNADKLIRAVARVKQARGQICPVIMIGRDPLGLQPGLKALAEDLNVAEDIRFLGRIDHHRLPCLYGGASMFVFPSAIETFGLPVLEAMACGTPVIGSNCTAVPEIVGDAGIVVDPTDIGEMASAIGQLLDSGELRSDMRAKGLQHVKSFTWERAAQETHDVFAEAHKRWQQS
jgi:glycosyltransferase involved in cell wall biosynthesis